nr:retrovirus-related Pol polyprotein from transposon TNT 1-94 [Tanacetum cinerariifolium]
NGLWRLSDWKCDHFSGISCERTQPQSLFLGQFCDSDLEVAFRQHTCFIRNLDRVDLLTGSQGNNLYTLSIHDMIASSPICLLSKASKTKSWLWHHRLSHLNFCAINHLARQGLVRGLPKLKFEKDHLCSACAMGKSTKKTHKPKSEDTNQEKLYPLHMDLCGPMRVESVNGKKYILVIIDDYSRFTWVKFLRSKDETPDFIIKFLKMIHQNGVVERCNRTLIEAARTMLIYAQAPLFLLAEAVATACFTQNRSIIRLRHGKTPYELLHNVQRTEAEQLKIALKRSKQETYISQQRGSGTYEGTEDTETGKGGDEVSESEGESEGESDEEETRQEEEESFDPIPRTPEGSEEENNDEED